MVRLPGVRLPGVGHGSLCTASGYVEGTGLAPVHLRGPEHVRRRATVPAVVLPALRQGLPPPVTPEQKIARARRLLCEAAKELRRQRLEARDKRQDEQDAQVCKCGHRHDEHGATHRPYDYTAGPCCTKGCRCRYFCLPRRPATGEN